MRWPHDFFDAHSDFFEGLRITLIDLDGTVVYDSEEPPAEMSNHLDLHRRRHSFPTRRSSDLRKNYRSFETTKKTGRYAGDGFLGSETALDGRDE